MSFISSLQSRIHHFKIESFQIFENQKKKKRFKLSHHSLTEFLIWIQSLGEKFKYPKKEKKSILQKNNFTRTLEGWKIFVLRPLRKKKKNYKFTREKIVTLSTTRRRGQGNRGNTSWCSERRSARSVEERRCSNRRGRRWRWWWWRRRRSWWWLQPMDHPKRGWGGGTPDPGISRRWREATFICGGNPPRRRIRSYASSKADLPRGIRRSFVVSSYPRRRCCRCRRRRAVIEVSKGEQEQE